VAVITGSAGGIGRGLAQRCVMEGMRVVLADVEEKKLHETEADLKAEGGDVLAVTCDVSKVDQVKHLADKTLDTYGAVHLLCNNAGVGAGGLISQHTLADWEWVIGVNLWGVIHGVHMFLPIMLEQGTPCHIVNTASVEGLWTRVSGASYQVSKHGVVALLEILKLEMAFAETKVGVSVLCPAAVNTGIVESGRNRPAELQNPPQDAPELTPEMEKRFAEAKKAFETGMAPIEVAAHVFRAVSEDRFFVLTHPEHNEVIKKRLDRILNDGVPLPAFTLSNMPASSTVS
jgi:NAD(P)-dependent dehydrogenase (short-subunit alcohol dehydrogenase family)